jgi:hypothetical protein
MRASIDACDIGKRPVKYVAWVKDGLSLRAKRGGQVIQQAHAPLYDIEKGARAQGGCTVIHIGAAANYPFPPVSYLSDPVMLYMDAQICKIAEGDRCYYAVHGRMETSEFPDFDVLVKAGGRWKPLGKAVHRSDHPAWGLASRPIIWNTSTVVIGPEDCCCDS